MCIVYPQLRSASSFAHVSVLGNVQPHFWRRYRERTCNIATKSCKKVGNRAAGASRLSPRTYSLYAFIVFVVVSEAFAVDPLALHGQHQIIESLIMSPNQGAGDKSPPAIAASSATVSDLGAQDGNDTHRPPKRRRVTVACSNCRFRKAKVTAKAIGQLAAC